MQIMLTINKRSALVFILCALGVVAASVSVYIYWTQATAIRQFQLLAASSKGEVSEVKRLLKEGADPNARFGGDGETPLHRAASAGRKEVVEILLGAGSDANAATAEGATPLLEASHNGHVEIARLLLEHGANVNAAERRHGFTPLQEAVRKSDVKLVKLFLERGADVYSKTIDGRDAFARAEATGNHEILTLLRAKITDNRAGPAQRIDSWK